MDHSPNSAPPGITDEPTDLTEPTKTRHSNDVRVLDAPPYAPNFQPKHWP
ncbi:hypothetical protein [Arthrobacter flavus]|uniref:Uncharacterized protein n=1 Tax=Arthrobacter flavus TaxID=95172 RepID=A0ABW4Q7E6_9MICC